ncbi:MAG: hypothetical protein JW793_08905 [Acidobacteria bacterium]|nr:hypothetical protein [Acidobacteriota bacterium]
MSNLYDREAERVILGAVIEFGTEPLAEALSAGLDPGHLYDEKHRAIFRALVDMAGRGIAIDALSLEKTLGDADIGRSFILDLSAGIPRAANVKHYAGEVVRLAKERKLLSAAENLRLAALEGNGELSGAVRDLTEAADDIRALPAKKHEFETLAEDRYKLSIPEIATTLEIDRLRRDRGELSAELIVRSELPGLPTHDGILHSATFNLSSARARSERASLIAKRAKIDKLDWGDYLEELCQQVIDADRAGQPAVDLRTLERPGPDDAIHIDRLVLPRRHPTIIFGDGGSAKSYIALHLIGRLAQQGLRVALFDWELDGPDHRDRLERLFGTNMPLITYARCNRPLYYECDRLTRIARDHRIEFAAYDSVAYACDGAPEAAEVANKYFQAVRRINVGSLSVAHISKQDGGDQKPFGSVFWHNSARATYFFQAVETGTGGNALSVGIFNRKANLGALLPPSGYTLAFTDATIITKSDPADTPALADTMSLRDRMKKILQGGAMTVKEVAEEASTKPDSIYKAVRRNGKLFTLLEGGKVALLQRVTG